MTAEVAEAIHPGMHGTTFGGGPLACAVALEVLKVIEDEKILGHVKEVGGYFLDLLQQLDSSPRCIRDVRGMGLMVGSNWIPPISPRPSQKAMLDAEDHHQPHARNSAAFSAAVYRDEQSNRSCSEDARSGSVLLRVIWLTLRLQCAQPSAETPQGIKRAPQINHVPGISSGSIRRNTPWLHVRWKMKLLTAPSQRRV